MAALPRLLGCRSFSSRGLPFTQSLRFLDTIDYLKVLGGGAVDQQVIQWQCCTALPRRKDELIVEVSRVRPVASAPCGWLTKSTKRLHSATHLSASFQRAAKFKTVGAKAIAFVTGEEQGSDSDSGLNYSGV